VRTVSFLGLVAAIALTAGPLSVAQEAAKGPPKAPTELFQQIRGLVDEGRFDLAAAYLQLFLDSNPSDQDILDLERKYGNSVFQQLRTVPRWSDDDKVDKKAKENVEALIARGKQVTEAKLRTPERVNKYIRNLGASYEERVFAEMELKRTGDYVVPFMVEALRSGPERQLEEGIVGAIAKLEPPSVAGWIAALDALPPEQQYQVIAAVVSRRDVMDLRTAAQTDYTPYLWRMADRKDVNPSLARYALSVLDAIHGGTAQKRKPEAELVAAARTFYDHKARFASTRTNADGSPARVSVWVWDAAAMKLTKLDDVPVGQAEEYYGLRYARWALERRPEDEDAQRLILALAAERAVGRMLEQGKLDDIARTDPSVYRMLSDAPSAVLNDLLEQALNQNRTSLIVAVSQVLADRADRTAVSPRPGNPPRPSLFERALGYPDPRVQLTAAVGLLRSPVPVAPAVRGRVVEVLRRAAAADPGVPGGAKGQALLTDPNKVRADGEAALLRSLGYEVEYFPTGRDLLRRVSQASDFDLILVDRHVVYPELTDVMGHLRADANASRRPVLVVASSDKPRPPTLDLLLLRLAVLIAATETDPTEVPPPYTPDLTRPVEERDLARRASQIRRDGALQQLARVRTERLLRVIDTIGLELTPAQRFMVELRAAQITVAVLAAEYPISPESAPESARKIAELNRQVFVQPPVQDYARRVGIDALSARIERLEQDVNREPIARKKFEDLRPKVDPEALRLNLGTTRDLAAEARVSRQVRDYRNVRVIPEPYSVVAFQDDVKSAFSDPAAAPRDPAEKRAAARTAVEWLRKLATGEIPGFDVKSAEQTLRDALRSDDLAEPAIDAVGRFSSPGAQQDLLNLALTAGRPVPLRVKAADAVIRHIQTFGKSIEKGQAEAVTAAIGKEENAEVRGKLLVIRGFVGATSAEFIGELRGYAPPIVPPPAKPPEKKGSDEPVPEPKPKDKQ
jgi:CheY-like chemotaxis protein